MDYYLDIVTLEKIQLSENLFLIGSKLGWLMAGRSGEESANQISRRASEESTLLGFVYTDQHNAEIGFQSRLDDHRLTTPNLEDLWKLDTIGFHDCPVELDDDKALESFNNTVKFHDKRYFVTWPWKSITKELPDNYFLAKGRLQCLLTKFKQNPELLGKYNEIIASQLQKGVIEKINHNCCDSELVHYIPHHAVVTPLKATTKVRIVYDASAKTKGSNASLNECLYRGPTFLQNLCGLLLRFSLCSIVLLSDIEKATNVEYRYVNTDSNPADWATRWKQVEELTCFWWEGPGWLKTSPEQWPHWNMPPIDNDMINKKESSLDVQTANGPMYEASLLCPVDSKGPFDLDAKQYSSLNKVLRITAFALRFISNCRSSNKRSGFLTASEIVFACTLWEKSSQKRYYGDVYEAVKNGKPHNLVNRLNLRLDETGILRCYGRLSNANLEPATKWPTLMHPNDPFTRLIVESFHRKLLHGGIAHTLAQVRTRYWIPRGRRIVRKVVIDCQICIKHQGGPYRLPKMPQLPSSRVTSSPPFTWSGLDYFGPLLIKHNGGTQKVWVALFSCVAVRAVHLELVLNMSVDEFLLCLRRFVARRGKPTLIICDNAPQFKAAKSVMDKVWQKTVIDAKITGFVASEGIQWKFISEMAPWQGGHYERLIGIVKRSLKKALGRLCLSLIQLQTMVAETEAIVNSRPLCFVGDDFEDGVILTPRHFLTLNPKSAMVALDKISKDDSEFLPEGSRESIIQGWKKGEAHLNEYWKQWQTNYLTGLRAFHTSLHKSPRICSTKDPEINEVVLVKDLSMPRGKWKIGRIEQLLHSSDQKIRSARLKMSNGRHLVRPVNFLFPLECKGSKEVPDSIVKSLDEDNSMGVTPTHIDPERFRQRENRAAFQRAKQRIREIIRDESNLSD